MHAYLIVGRDRENLAKAIKNLTDKLHAKMMEFPLVKIDDVRSLNSLIRLSFENPTVIVSKNIHEAGEEALNAFLKNLEEPQENIYFALTTPTIRKVLPTIVSRCEIVRIKNQGSEAADTETEKFVKLETDEKLAFIDKIKDRAKAIEFSENLVKCLHKSLHLEKVDYDKTAKNLEVANETLDRIKANGNVSLQLTNMCIRLS